MSNIDWDSYEFRYVAAQGVEYRPMLPTNYAMSMSGGPLTVWQPLTGDDLLSMDAATLRRVADAMDDGDKPPFADNPDRDGDLAAGWEDLEDDWIRHDGVECPVHPMDMVETDWFSKPVPAYRVAWDILGHYRPLRDEHGDRYVYNDGSLRPSTEYVATRSDGTSDEYTSHEHYGRPFAGCIMFVGSWLGQGPFKYANTLDHWTETLRRVWRES